MWKLSESNYIIIKRGLRIMKAKNMLLKTILTSVILCVFIISSGAMSASAEECKKNKQDIKALREIVKKQKALGAKVSYNPDNRRYIWDKNGRLVWIRWNQKSLKGELDLSGLKKLKIVSVYQNQLTSLIVKKNKKLEILDCSENYLKELDVTNNLELEDLSCYNNKFTKLDVRNNKNLKSLDCGYSISSDFGFGYLTLEELDVSKNKKLRHLGLMGVNFKSLDLENNKKLMSLSYEDSTIEGATIDISNNTKLKKIVCYNSGLTSIDISNNSRLKELYCDSNNLTSLDIRNNSLLKMLYCSENKLTNLDVSNNTLLKKLHCYSNKLTKLDISNNGNLLDLSCDDNKLTSLDLSKNTLLESLSCENNSITELDIRNNPNLRHLYYNGKVKLMENDEN